jgi:hypothetical protein
VRLEQEIGRIRKALDEVLRAPNGLAALEVLLRYLVATHARLSMQKVGEVLEKAAGPEAREAIVTVLDEIEQRGERRGRAQGRAQMLLELLSARFGSVPAEVSAQVMAAGKVALSRWAIRVLTASTLEEVFGEGSGGVSPARRPSASKRARRR